MERHAFTRVFYLDSDVMLYANVTEMVAMLYPRSPLLLAVRWPSLFPPLSPSQYPTTAVSGHVSVWTYEALADFLALFMAFFEHAVLYGTPGDPALVPQRAYNDMVPLGWYTFSNCWLKPPEDLHPQCIADKASGVTPDRSARLRGRFAPRFAVESLLEPRMCGQTSWSDAGFCAFDNNFSVQKPRQFFRYRPLKGMKMPTSRHFAYFEDWASFSMNGTKGSKRLYHKGRRKNETSIQPLVQFLGVHFQAHKKGYLSRGEEPAATWGSSPD
eukprot:TRINITY_DN1333_c0_g1_i2.p2 TRINITY_DN1333_c0_g1~~TRINITY_DN1333_c0_g1_i2.p2  ORF type:complete len:271 (-),score=20.66 TRINITY_DN1333_c0_g1_i2:454-1266(-)